MSDHARFQVKGTVKRVFSTSAFASVTISVFGERERKIDVKAFREQSAQLGKLKEGDEVTVAGDIKPEKLTDRAKQEIKVDGYNKWVNALVVDTVKAEASKNPIGDDRNPDGW